jgi:hypothetical protein
LHDVLHAERRALNGRRVADDAVWRLRTSLAWASNWSLAVAARAVRMFRLEPHVEFRVLVWGSQRKASEMKKLMVISTVALMVAGFTADSAFAKHHYHHRGHRMGSGMTTGSSMGSGSGGNAALSGNNGNSASGSNSLGHVKGGDIGGGK